MRRQNVLVPHTGNVGRSTTGLDLYDLVKLKLCLGRDHVPEEWDAVGWTKLFTSARPAGSRLSLEHLLSVGFSGYKNDALGMFPAAL